MLSFSVIGTRFVEHEDVFGFEITVAGVLVRARACRFSEVVHLGQGVGKIVHLTKSPSCRRGCWRMSFPVVSKVTVRSPWKHDCIFSTVLVSDEMVDDVAIEIMECFQCLDLSANVILHLG